MTPGPEKQRDEEGASLAVFSSLCRQRRKREKHMEAVWTSGLKTPWRFPSSSESEAKEAATAKEDPHTAPAARPGEPITARVRIPRRRPHHGDRKYPERVEERCSQGPPQKEIPLCISVLITWSGACTRHRAVCSLSAEVFLRQEAHSPTLHGVRACFSSPRDGVLGRAGASHCPCPCAVLPAPRTSSRASFPARMSPPK